MATVPGPPDDRSGSAPGGAPARDERGAGPGARPDQGLRDGGIAARALGAARPPADTAASYLAGLNPEQRRAVETTEGPVLVLAGAGTGKTRVLTTRIGHILASRLAFPSQILAVTFTNKAAREMRTRVSALVGEAVEGMPWLGTFHAIGTRFLRRHAELAELKQNFTILDTDDQQRLMKQVIQAANIDEKRWPVRQLASMIDGWKNRGLGPEAVQPAEGRVFANKGAELYAAYQGRLTDLNAVDFGDLLMLPIRILRDNPEILADYRKRFRYILVDEYQDTNTAQYLWLRLLAPAGANICCVGDDDQSIYGWRGADVDNILRFEHDYPGAAVIRLERNYRSTAPILASASHLIAHNQDRLGKTLFTERSDPDDERVTVAAAWDSEEEARAIGEEIESLHRKGHRLDEIAILVRASFQMRELEDRFVTLGLPYRVIGGPRFYERMEIRDALAYFRVVAQPADDLAFERIVNTPKRGLGDATVKLLHDTARLRRVPLARASAELVETEELKPKVRATLRGLLADFDRWRHALETKPHTELAEMILDESGYTEMWKADRSAEAPGRLENLKELVRSMQGFESLAGFLEHVSLVMEAESGANQDAVTLMTLHAAKGLEFDTVFLPGWEEGVFPNQRALDESGRAGLEEERRLAYVGLTRARRRLFVWFAANRRVHGMWQSSVPSRFLDELPRDHVEVREGPGYGGRSGGYGPSRFDRVDPFASRYTTPGWERGRARAQAEAVERDGGGRSQPRGRVIEGELVARSTGTSSAYAVGQRVFHLKFGNGTVRAVDGNKLTVDFDKAGEKRVLDSFVEPA